MVDGENASPGSPLRQGNSAVLQRGSNDYKSLVRMKDVSADKGLSSVQHARITIKAKFGQQLRSRTLSARINEALWTVLCHNLCVVIQSMYELGIAPEFTSEAA